MKKEIDLRSAVWDIESDKSNEKDECIAGMDEYEMKDIIVNHYIDRHYKALKKEEMKIDEFMKDNILERYNNIGYWDIDMIDEFNTSKIYKIVEVADNVNYKLTPEMLYNKWNSYKFEELEIAMNDHILGESGTSSTKKEMIEMIENTIFKD